MPTFPTPEPIVISVDIAVGGLHVIAGDRADTTVTVNPTDADRGRDVQVAQGTTVDLREGRLTIWAPRPQGLGSLVAGANRYGSVDVVLEAPAGSSLEVHGGVTNVRADGTVGEVRITTGVGDIRLDRTGPARVKTTTGNVSVDRIGGNATLTAAGRLEVGHVEGDANAKNLTGETWIGEVVGDVVVRSSSGDIAVDRACQDLEARTASGDVRIGEVVSGSVGVATAGGQVEIGVRDGTAVWIDARTKWGRVTSSLEAADGPEDHDHTVELRARTSHGDIDIVRS